MKENWYIKNIGADFNKIGADFSISPILARLAVNRGIKGSKEMEAYLFPKLTDLHDPHGMKDAVKACEILTGKIKERKRIRVIGDYDVDGVMATYILYTGLKVCGADVDYEIPDRIKDGYGIHIGMIGAAAKEGIDTIITCDNGIAAKEQIACAKAEGMTVIVTDHHEVPIEEGVPDADAVVNPRQEECGYPFKGICGAVVAYKVMEILYEKWGLEQTKIYEFLEFAAIATVCDVMDLIDENRILVKYGMQAFERTRNPGLRALKEVCGLTGKKIGAYHFGFVIGPCINASGRLESAKKSLRMLLAPEQEAQALAKELKQLNDERKQMTEEGLAAAVAIVEEEGWLRDKVLAVYLENCHESLAGIIAGRLRERYNRPVLVLTRAEEGVKGSGRSIESYSMFEELSRCREYLTKFGGHPMAAGLSLPEENVEAFREALNKQTTLKEEDLIPRVSFDMVLPLEEISIGLIRQFEKLEPYGKGNGKPSFALKDVRITRGTLLGASKNVLKLMVHTDTAGGSFTAMLFQNSQAFLEALDEKYGNGAAQNMLRGQKEYIMDFIFYPDINVYNGMESIQLMIQHYR